MSELKVIMGTRFKLFARKAECELNQRAEVQSLSCTELLRCVWPFMIASMLVTLTIRRHPGKHDRDVLFLSWAGTPATDLRRC